jgi:diguanylate cyclase (GGDEF)-like protein
MRDVLPFTLAAFGFTVLSALGFCWRIWQVNRRLRAARADALKLADCDPLTGIANRRVLQRSAEAALALGAPCQMLMIDFDGFKEVNDRLGHTVGDALLVEMSARMQRLCPEGALLARQGGDEFAVLRPGTSDGVAEFGQDLIFAISAPFQIQNQNQTISISASVGVAGIEPGMSAEELLHRADVAMYEAKAHKPGAVHFYHDCLDVHTRDSVQLDRDMRNGLGAGEFWVAYQPIYSVKERRIVGVEALARWTHPTRGPIGPHIFIPVAEQSLFIGTLGEFILREACTAFASVPEIKVSVNLSPVQLLDDRLVERIAGLLEETGLPASRLELEVTEGYLIEQEDRAAEVMNRLRALGLRISLDDFGCGYASVGYLRRFPLDKVKIDRSFIDTIDTDEQARRVVAAIIALCGAFGIPITAEGVETTAQADLLRDMGCDLLQGYLIGRPAPFSDIMPSYKLTGG